MSENFYDVFKMHLLEDEKPSIYFNRLIEEKKYPNEYPYTLLSDLLDIPQSPVHHPEGNVWYHVMMVTDYAAKYKENSDNPIVFMWAALLHDLGKKTATRLKKGRIVAYDHDSYGEEPAKDFMQTLSGDEHLSYEVSKLVRWHMQPLYMELHLPFLNLKDLSKSTLLSEIALLSYCDRLGRGKMTPDSIDNEFYKTLKFIANSLNYLDREGARELDSNVREKQSESLRIMTNHIKTMLNK